MTWTEHAMKLPAMVEFYERLIAELRPQRILELGIYQGGSLLWMAELARPERLVGVDIEGGCPALDAELVERGLTEVVQPYYGVDQADGLALDEIVATFDGPLDLVIDDASHDADLTLASFNRLFPCLREGGVYVIEDVSPYVEALDGRANAATTMSGLVVDLVRASYRLERAIPEVTARRDWAVVYRGPGDLVPGRFDLRRVLGAD